MRCGEFEEVVGEMRKNGTREDREKVININNDSNKEKNDNSNSQ